MKAVITYDKNPIEWPGAPIPCLVVSKLDRFVVLVTRQSTGETFNGVVLTESEDGIGYYTDKWLKDGFELFEGEVKLRNG